jgi:hypothetical protein
MIIIKYMLINIEIYLAKYLKDSHNIILLHKNFNNFKFLRILGMFIIVICSFL